jgi:UDP-N-acetylmuramoyl-tripeptide--D-alanyl-D-alanine ligase
VPAGEPLLEPYLRDEVDVRRVDPAGAVELGDGEVLVTFAGRAFRFPFGSRHQAANALAALHAYDALGLPLDRAQEGAAAVRFSAWRGEQLPLPGGGLVVNDAYNANPSSVRAALDHLSELAGGRRAIAVLGGMAELGPDGPRYHLELAAHASGLGIELLAVGELARAYGADRWAPGPDEALAELERLLEPGDVLLVKASRAVGLEGVAPALANREAAWSES